MPATGLSILVADDNAIDRMILETILHKDGHQVFTATNGREAVDSWREFRQAIVLMDALMPEMDGFEAARHIREMAGETLVPIIFLTALTDTPSLLRCLEAGGDDFLSKPYNRVILQAKIKAFNRMREMHSTMQAQRNQIAHHHDLIVHEQKVARQVFDNIAHSGCLDASNVRYFLSSMAIFNGDVLLAAMTPSGNMMVLLGDFTGHGLPAAISAMPLVTTFYGMVPKGFSLQDILREINSKLKHTLPVGFFCCAVMIEVNFSQRQLCIWNGGLPDAVLHHSQMEEVQRFRSTHLPLGVLNEKQFQVNCEYVNVHPQDRFYMWSDGIHEAMNSSGEMFGEERLLSLFADHKAESRFDRILQEVNLFAGSESKQDDVSLFEIVMSAPLDPGSHDRLESKAMTGRMHQWQLDFDIQPATFKVFDPLPLLLQILMEVPGLQGSATSLYTILAELYSNALEHGILKLDSAIKQQPDGFKTYYQLREERLQQAYEGAFIAFSFDCCAEAHGGRLVIRVRDSGDGFDYHRAPDAGDASQWSGRGLYLLSKLCHDMKFHGNGNDIEVHYVWNETDNCEKEVSDVR